MQATFWAQLRLIFLSKQSLIYYYLECIVNLRALLHMKGGRERKKEKKDESQLADD
jgi:hypothetical protein